MGAPLHVALQQQGVGLQGKGGAEVLLEGPEAAHGDILWVTGEGEPQGGVARGRGQLVGHQRTLREALWQGGVLQRIISAPDKLVDRSHGSQ